MTPRRGIFFWFFALLLPAEPAALVLSTLVHEFAHGLVALALGGRFLGTKSEFFSRDAEVLAYADAWSERGEAAVYAAGILACVAVGILLCRKAARTPSAPARVLLYVLAAACLSDLGYAFDGCLHWRTAPYDTAFIFDDLDSPELRWLGLVFLFPAWVFATAFVAKGHFRAWEDILGPLGFKRAAAVLLLFVAPLPASLLRLEEDRSLFYLSLLIVVGVSAWLLRIRRRDVDAPPPTKTGRWIGATWAVALLAAAAAGVFERGIRFGTYPDHHLYEIRPEEEAVAGLFADFGMGDSRGENRPVHDARLFVARPDGAFVLPSPASDPLDLTWRSSTRTFLLVTPRALIEVGERGNETLWAPEAGLIRSAGHGPDGELLLVLESSKLLAYDARSRVLREFTTEGDLGNPFFLPGPPARARIGVGRSIWEVTWDEDGVRADTLPDESEDEGWYEGTSRDGHWWSDEEGWTSGDTWIPRERLSSWGVGLAGFYTLDRRGTWTLTTAAGRVEREGRVGTPYYLSFQIHDGLPWVALKTGEVRRLDAGAPPFRVKLPEAP